MTAALDKGLAAVADRSLAADIEFLAQEAFFAGHKASKTIDSSPYDSFTDFWDAARSNPDHAAVFAIKGVVEVKHPTYPSDIETFFALISSNGEQGLCKVAIRSEEEGSHSLIRLTNSTAVALAPEVAAQIAALQAENKRLQLEKEALRDALGAIAWSNNTVWQADCARQALAAQPVDETTSTEGSN